MAWLTSAMYVSQSSPLKRDCNSGHIVGADGMKSLYLKVAEASDHNDSISALTTSFGHINGLSSIDSSGPIITYSEPLVVGGTQPCNATSLNLTYRDHAPPSWLEGGTGCAGRASIWDGERLLKPGVVSIVFRNWLILAKYAGQSSRLKRECNSGHIRRCWWHKIILPESSRAITPWLEWLWMLKRCIIYKFVRPHHFIIRVSRRRQYPALQCNIIEFDIAWPCPTVIIGRGNGMCRKGAHLGWKVDKTRCRSNWLADRRRKHICQAHWVYRLWY